MAEACDSPNHYMRTFKNDFFVWGRKDQAALKYKAPRQLQRKPSGHLIAAHNTSLM